MADQYHSDRDYQATNLSKFPGLRKLSFPLTWDEDNEIFHDYPDYLFSTTVQITPPINRIEPFISILSTASSSNRLEYLELVSENFSHELIGIPTSSQWDALSKMDELLAADDHFPSLKQVTIRERDEIDMSRKGGFKPRVPSSDILLAARTHLPNLVGKGMLSFEWFHSTFWGHETHRTINIP
ncbi:hypothetical protein ONZ45_g14351 [Pleurotus djamor]|nr:hypothetical protein ONZ45_g14351 [Pleurotus djamor]